MDVIKKKILLESAIDRGNNSPTYGVMTATSFSVNVMLVQNIDDMGIFTDVLYIPRVGASIANPDYTILIDKLTLSGITFPFMSGLTPTYVETDSNYVLRLTGTTPVDYYFYGNEMISGYTESKLNDVKTYITSEPYIVDFDVNSEGYVNYINENVSGVTRVTNISNTVTYVFDADSRDLGIGTKNQRNGLLYIDYTGETRTITQDDGEDAEIIKSEFSFIGEGLNETNTSLSAITKEEYLYGIVFTPEVQSDIFIDRGNAIVLEQHLRLSEIRSVNQLERYNNSFYNINK